MVEKPRLPISKGIVGNLPEHRDDELVTGNNPTG
jgi:hypothetical protein